MREKYKHLKEVKWLVMDILDMTFEPKEFNVVGYFCGVSIHSHSHDCTHLYNQ